jgi:uncharacterized damage-inducible protein DinB
MDSTDLLIDAFGRVRDAVHAAIDDLTPDQLAFRLDDDANSIGWLVWHLTRVQDDHIADVARTEQVWTAAGWADRFALPFDTAATGYGHGSADVGAVRVESGKLLSGYHDAVYNQTVAYLDELTESDFERIVDDSWDPPVTLAVRVVSVVCDDLQHVGQAAFVRGIVERPASDRDRLR